MALAYVQWDDDSCSSLDDYFWLHSQGSLVEIHEMIEYLSDANDQYGYPDENGAQL